MLGLSVKYIRLFRASHDLTSWPAYWLACQTLGPDDQGRLLGRHLLQKKIFFSLVMQNYFIQVIWNYINDKNYTP